MLLNYRYTLDTTKKRRLFATIFLLLINFVFISKTFSQTDCALEKSFHALANNKKSDALFVNFPKGGDLHLHLAGAVYPEEFILIGQHNDYCIDLKTFTAYPKPQCRAHLPMAQLSKTLYKQTIAEWSLKNITEKDAVTAHDHFFDAFKKFINITNLERANMLHVILRRAAIHHIRYLEIMNTLDNNLSATIASEIIYNNNFKKLQKIIENKDLDKNITATEKDLEQLQLKTNKLLGCDKNAQAIGCQVHYKFMYEILREQAPQKVFASLLFGFKLASKNSDVVGINLSQAEDGRIASRDYRLHMQMIRFLKKQFPKVKISLHAGELTPTLVNSKDLQFHIQSAIKTAGAKRIGHGISIQYEKNLTDLIDMMKKKNVLVEINLSSNQKILGITGEKHPLSFYLKSKILVALSTDDEGLLRSSLSDEYQNAYKKHALTYCQLKQLSRNALTYSFLPGQSLWSHSKTIHRACQDAQPGINHVKRLCRQFLKRSPKATLQWQLEKDFLDYEAHYLRNVHDI